MEVDIRKHKHVREDVRTGLAALRVQGRQIWGSTRHTLPEIVVRLMVGVGDLARAERDGCPKPVRTDVPAGPDEKFNMSGEDWGPLLNWERSLKKELGNLILSTVRWIDDLGHDPLECLDLAVEAQERFAQSGRPR